MDYTDELRELRKLRTQMIKNEKERENWGERIVSVAVWYCAYLVLGGWGLCLAVGAWMAFLFVRFFVRVVVEDKKQEQKRWDGLSPAEQAKQSEAEARAEPKTSMLVWVGGTVLAVLWIGPALISILR